MDESAAPLTPAPKSRVAIWFAVGLFVFALGFRLIGITWGLANDLHFASYHPDEPVTLAAAQRVDPAHGQFTPGFYNYGTFYLTTLRIASDMVSTYTGAPDPRNPRSLWDWISRVHLVGRVMSAIAGAGLVVFVFLLLNRFVGLFGAVFGALLPAVAPAMVVHSRFQSVDIPAAFWIAASAWAALRLFPDREGGELTDREAMKTAIWSGIFAGLSAGTKYTGIFALITLIVAAGLAKRSGARLGAAPLAGAGIAAGLLAFLVTTPGIFLDTSKFTQDFMYEMNHTATGHGLVFANTPSGFVFHFINLIFGIGLLGSAFGLAGLGWGVFRRNGWLIALGAFWLAYYLLIGRAEVKFLRYTFPLYIGLAAGFGYLMAEAQRRGGYGRIVVALGIAAIGGIDFGGMISAARMTTWMVQTDPRDAAALYLRQSPDAVGLASDPWFYTPPLWPEAGLPRSYPSEVRWEQMAASQPPVDVRFGPNRELYAFNMNLLAENPPPRIVMSSFEFSDPLRLRNVPNLPEDIRIQAERAGNFQDRLTQDYVIDRVFAPDFMPIHDLEYIHPQVQIWKRKTTP